MLFNIFFASPGASWYNMVGPKYNPLLLSINSLIFSLYITLTISLDVVQHGVDVQPFYALATSKFSGKCRTGEHFMLFVIDQIR